VHSRWATCSVDTGGAADRDVDALEQEVDDAVVDAEVDAQLGVGHGPRAQAGDDAGEAEGDRRADLDRAAQAGLAEGLGVVDVAEDAQAALVVALAGLGDRHPARRAGDQRRADVVLEGGELPADGGGREVALAAGGGEAAGLDHADEGGHPGEEVHGHQRHGVCVRCKSDVTAAA
jgi:hypothetical protein